MGVRTDVLRRQADAAREAGFDALVATSPENVAYLLGFVVPSQPILRWRHAATVVTADGEHGVLVVDMEATTVRDRLPDSDVRMWREFADDAMEVLATLLGDLDLAKGRIGIETNHLPARDLYRLQELLPRARFDPAEQVFDQLRRIKSPEETSLLRHLSRITDRAILHALGSISVGASERDLAAAVTSELYRLGAEHHKFLIVATGERSRYPNVGPSDRVLSDGDVIRLEVFGVIGGYHAGVCRTAVMGRPAPEVERVAATLLACRDAVLANLRPGVRASDVYAAYLDEFRRLGHAPIDFVGHGIGLHVHEGPYLSSFDDTILTEGMVFGVEPLLYGPEFGVQFKDMVAITHDGAQILSDVWDGTGLIRLN